MPLERINIPAAALAVKPHFPVLPDREIIEEIRLWVHDGNPTYTWRGHTHTEPAMGEPIEYAGDFQLSKGVEAPCPCCTPEFAKFNVGLIAWFPETHLVRLMGQHCFRKLNPEGHASAYRNLQDRIKRQGVIRYLVNNLPKRQEAAAALDRAIPIARHLDDLQDILGEKLKRTFKIDLWQQVRDGSLKVATGASERQFFTNYATIDGARLIDPGRTKILPRIETATKGLANIDVPADIEAASDAVRDKIARQFGRAMKIAQGVVADIDECRRFLSPLNVATIRAWGARLDAPIQIYMRRDALTLMIGQTEDDPKPINLDASLDLPTPRLPEILI